jgi:hypothetical protein
VRESLHPVIEQSVLQSQCQLSLQQLQAILLAAPKPGAVRQDQGGQDHVLVQERFDEDLARAEIGHRSVQHHPFREDDAVPLFRAEGMVHVIAGGQPMGGADSEGGGKPEFAFRFDEDCARRGAGMAQQLS